MKIADLKSHPSKNRYNTVLRSAVVILVAAGAVYLFSAPVLTAIGGFIVVDDVPVRSDAIVVLNSGVEYYPRLIEAASLYKRGFAQTIVINGNRKSDVLRELEGKGFEACCPWHENSVRILSLFGVPRSHVVNISLEDAYDTISEAKVLGKDLLSRGFKQIIITTSKYHTRRAGFIWKKLFKNQLAVRTIAAKKDPYDPGGWWREGRQIRWVLAEYGAWVFYVWKSITNDIS
ncbi:MAG: YdcF family protein [Thermodesulfobacteriota bacterium]